MMNNTASLHMSMLPPVMGGSQARYLTSVPDPLAAIHTTLGHNTPAGWLNELDTEGLEVYMTPERALVLVDRTPMRSCNGCDHFRSPLNGLGGTQLNLVAELEELDGSVMHGVYGGMLGGAAVVVDQYMHLRNGVPTAIVRVITRVNGTGPGGPLEHQRFVDLLLEGD